jgi:hypothetical protein
MTDLDDSNIIKQINDMENELNKFNFLKINNNFFKNYFFNNTTFKNIPNIIYNTPILITNNISNYTFSNIPIIFNLYDYFKSPTNNYNLNFEIINQSNLNYYYDTHNIYQSNLIYLNNSNLTIYPNYRNTQYTLHITSYLIKSNYSQTFYLTIIENSIPLINIYNNTIIHFYHNNNNNITCNINNFFNYKHFNNISYSNFNNNFNFNSNNGAFYYNFDYTNIIDTFNIKIFDRYYINNQITITLKFYNKNSLYINNYSNIYYQLNYNNNINIINLNKYVSNIYNNDIINYTLISSDHYDHYLINSNLIINSYYTNKQYYFKFIAYISLYSIYPTQFNINFIELPKPTPFLFNSNTVITNIYNINLNNYFSNLYINNNNNLIFDIDNKTNFNITNNSNLNLINKFNRITQNIYVNVIASNILYSTSNNHIFTFLQKPYISHNSINNILNISNIITINLNNYFINNLDYNSNIYRINITTLSNIVDYYIFSNNSFYNLNSNILSFIPNFRTNLYNIEIIAYHYNYPQYEYSNNFIYSEKPLNYITINTKINCNIILEKNFKIKNSFDQYINLNNYFINNNNIKFQYYFSNINYNNYNNNYINIDNNLKLITDNYINDSNICKIQDNILTFYYNNRPFIYTLYIYTSNITYNFKSKNLILHIKEEPYLFNINNINDIYYYENNKQNIQNDNYNFKIILNDFIKYKNDEDVIYKITTDNNYIDSDFYELIQHLHILNIKPNFRNIKYKVIISVEDADYSNINATTFFYVNESFYKFNPNQFIYYINQKYNNYELDLYTTFFTNDYYNSNQIIYNINIDNTYKKNYINLILNFNNNKLYFTNNDLFNVGYIGFNYKIINTTNIKIYNKLYNTYLEYDYNNNFIIFKPKYIGIYFYNNESFQIKNFNEFNIFTINNNNLNINNIKSPFFPIKLTISCRDKIYNNNILLNNLILYKIYLRHFYYNFNNNNIKINLYDNFISTYNIKNPNDLKFNLKYTYNNIYINNNFLNINQSFKGTTYSIFINIYNNLYKISENIYNITEPKPFYINNNINKKYYVNKIQPVIDLKKYIIKNNIFNYNCNILYKYNGIEYNNSIFTYNNNFIYDQLISQHIHIYYKNYTNNFQSNLLILYFKEDIIKLNFISINNNFSIIEDFTNLENLNIIFDFTQYIKTTIYKYKYNTDIILCNLNNDYLDIYYELYNNDYNFSNVLYKPFFRNIKNTLYFNVNNINIDNSLINTINFKLIFYETFIYKLTQSNIILNLNYIQCNINLNNYINYNYYIFQKYNYFNISNVKIINVTSNYNIRNSYYNNFNYHNFNSNNNIVTINPNFRNILYNLNFIVYLDNYISNINTYYSNTITFTIIENKIPNILNNKSNIYITLEKEIIYYNLNNYYIEYPFYDKLIYTCNIICNITNNYLHNFYNYFNINTSNLIINSDFRNINYTINIISTDIYFKNSNINLNFNIIELPILNFKNNNIISITLSNNSYKFYYSNLFQKNELLENCNFIFDLKNTNLNHNFKINSYNYNYNYFYNSNNEYLIIYPEYRNSIYNITFEVYLNNFDKNYHKHDITFIITENKIPNIININNSNIYNNLSNQQIIINLNQYFIYEYLYKLQYYYNINFTFNHTQLNYCNLNLDFYIFNSNLYINTDYRNITYNIQIFSFENNKYTNNIINSNLIFKITELPPFILTHKTLIFSNLSNQEININLNNYIINYTNCNLNNIIYTPNFRNLKVTSNYNLFFNNYNYYTESIKIIYNEISSFTLINNISNIFITNLSNINKIINLNNYINNNTLNNINISNINNNNFDKYSYSNNYLILKPLYRGYTYDLDFYIYINNYKNQSKNIKFTITELNINIQLNTYSNIYINIYDSFILCNLLNYYNYDFKEQLIFTYNIIPNNNNINYNINIQNNSNLIINYHYNYNYTIIIISYDKIFNKYNSNLNFIVNEYIDNSIFKTITVIDDTYKFNLNIIDNYIYNNYNQIRFYKTWNGTPNEQDKQLKVDNLYFYNVNWYQCNIEIKDIGMFIKDKHREYNYVCIGDFYSYTKNHDHYTDINLEINENYYIYNNHNIFHTGLNKHNENDDNGNIIMNGYEFNNNIELFLIINNYKLYNINSNIIPGYYIIKSNFYNSQSNFNYFKQDNILNIKLNIEKTIINKNIFTIPDILNINYVIHENIFIPKIYIQFNNNIINNTNNFKIYKKNNNNNFHNIPFRDPYDPENEIVVDLTNNIYSNIIINIEENSDFADFFYCYDFKRHISSNFNNKIINRSKKPRFSDITNNYTLFNNKIKLDSNKNLIIDKYDLYYDVIYRYSFKIFNIITGNELKIFKDIYIPYGPPVDFIYNIDKNNPIITFKWNHNPRNLYNIDNNLNPTFYKIQFFNNINSQDKYTNSNIYIYYFNNLIDLDTLNSDYSLNNYELIYNYYSNYNNDKINLNVKLQYNKYINIISDDGISYQTHLIQENYIKQYEYLNINIPKYFNNEQNLEFTLLNNIKYLNTNTGNFFDYIRIKINNYTFKNDNTNNLDYDENNLYILNNNTLINNKIDNTLNYEIIYDNYQNYIIYDTNNQIITNKEDFKNVSNTIYININNIYRNTHISLKIVKFKIFNNNYIKFSNFINQNIFIVNIPNIYLNPLPINNFNISHNNYNNYINLTWDISTSIFINSYNLYQIKINNLEHYHCNLPNSNIYNSSLLTLKNNFSQFKFIKTFNKHQTSYEINNLKDNNYYLYKLIGYHNSYATIINQTTDSNLYSYAIDNNSSNFVYIKTFYPRKAPYPHNYNILSKNKNEININWTNMNDINIWNYYTKNYSIDDILKYKIIRKFNNFNSYIYNKYNSNYLNDNNLSPNSEFIYEIYTLTNMNLNNNYQYNYLESDNCNLIKISTLKPITDYNYYLNIMPPLDFISNIPTNILKWKLPNISNLLDIDMRYTVSIENYYKNYYSNINLINYSNVNNLYNINIPDFNDKFKPKWREYTNKIINSNVFNSYWKDNIYRSIDPTNISILWRDSKLILSNIIHVEYNINALNVKSSNLLNDDISFNSNDFTISTLNRYIIEWWKIYNRWEGFTDTTQITHLRLDITNIIENNYNFYDNDIISVLQKNSDSGTLYCLDSLKWKDIKNKNGDERQFMCPNININSQYYFNSTDPIYFERWNSSNYEIEILQIIDYYKFDHTIDSYIDKNYHITNIPQTFNDEIIQSKQYRYDFIKIKRNIQNSYDPVIIEFNINGPLFENCIIYILQYYTDIKSFEYLDKNIIKNTINNDNYYSNHFICSRKIPLRNNHYGFTNINDIYFELLINDKLITLSANQPIQRNQNTYHFNLYNNFYNYYSYNSIEIDFNCFFTFKQNSLISIIQFKNYSINPFDINNILCLDTVNLTDNEYKFTISQNIPYINKLFYLQDKPIYIVLYESNIIQLLNHNTIYFTNQYIEISKFTQFSYNPKIFNLNNNTIFYNNDIISVIDSKNNKCLDVYKWNDNDNYKQLICSSKLPFDLNNYGISDNNELYFLLFRNHKIYTLKSQDNNIIYLNSNSNINLQINYYYDKYIIFNIQNIQNINPNNNDIISILQFKNYSNLECIGKYIYNYLDNSNQIICIYSSNNYSNLGINIDINNNPLYYEIYRNNLNIIEKLDFNIQNINIYNYSNFNNININILNKTFILYSNGILFSNLNEKFININNNIYTYNINNNFNNNNIFNITWYYTNFGFSNESSITNNIYV